jgi:hypothetical protein
LGNSNPTGVTYAWVGPNNYTSNQQNPTVSMSGDYTLTATNTINGCTSTASVSVPSLAAPNASATGGTLTCGSPSVQLMGSSTPTNVDYAWTGPNGFTSNLQNPMVAVAGNYLLTVTSSNGCTATATATVDQSGNLPQASPAASGILTCAVTQVTIMANPNMAGYTYAWTGPAGFISTAQNPSVTEPGLYSVLVTNPTTGCTATFSAVVTELVPPTISFDIPDIVINCTTTTATVDLSAICNLPGITCKLNGQVVTGPVVILQTGTNLLEVFDNASGCLMGSDEFGVTQDIIAPDLTVTGDQDLPCADDVTTLTASSSTPGVAFEWSGLGNNPSQTVPPGTYIVTATGQNGCETVETVMVTAPPVLQIVAVNTFVDCDGNFAPDIVIAGGVPPYVFDITTLPMPSGITFEILVTDANGCTTSASGTITIPAPIEVDITHTDETVLGANDGTATISANGGNPPYDYAWSDGQAGQTATNLAPGNYGWTVTDANGCTETGTVVIQEGVNATQDLPGLRRLALSPNPTSGRFELAIALENPMAVQVELLDVAGRILSKTNLENVLEKTWQFDLTASPSGVYFCKITTDGHVAVRKVVKVD